ncbi:hypothetical protein BC936DRAFT_145943 [Jimgerdemannia flammicorona]|uniref:DUF885 domain-containing protein n=1 Tax=Jimgerdemannia flammicorona TaxID=994334 RepID=A0A433D8U7_9FUNG|nr:hypothetical protein BC936DRAFT_145943 [Jimgerdemannia flammicorona]
MTNFADAIKALKDDYVEWGFKQSPEFGPMFNVYKYGDQITHVSRKVYDANLVHLEGQIALANAFDVAQLTAAQVAELDYFKEVLQKDKIDALDWGYELCTSHMTGVLTIFQSLPVIQVFRDKEDLANYRKRLQQIPGVIDELIEAFRAGIKSGITHNEPTIEILIKMTSGMIVDDPAKSPFNTLDKLEKVGEEDKSYLIDAIKSISPAYQKLQNFLRDEYLPAGRAGAGIYGLPDYERIYNNKIYSCTTVRYTAKDLHDLGEREVARIAGLMEETKEKVGFTGTLQEFFKVVQQKDKYPQLHLANNDAVLANYERLLDVIDAKLPALFATFPERKCKITAVPPYREASDPMAFYQPGSAGEPGRFYVNMALHGTKAAHCSNALTLHEANPGHHHQISLYFDTGDRHVFDKVAQTIAYVEGWGLYSEYLGEEMGMYDDPFQYMGRLEMEMHRALRLVVDTGLHAFGWTAEHALEYMSKYLSLSEAELKSEIFRYTVMPGQALAYKIGEIKIKELRRHAEVELGSKFDIRQFHETVLAQSLTLGALEKYVNVWIEKVKNS